MELSDTLTILRGQMIHDLSDFLNEHISYNKAYEDYDKMLKSPNPITDYSLRYLLRIDLENEIVVEGEVHGSRGLNKNRYSLFDRYQRRNHSRPECLKTYKMPKIEGKEDIVTIAVYYPGH